MRLPTFLSCLILISSLTLLARHSLATEFKTNDKGIAIDAGSLGEFELSYPSFFDAQQKPVHKLVEARPTGQAASLRYEGAGTVKVTTDAQGEVVLTFADIPADVKSFAVEMLIDIGFNKGGKWKAGDKEGTFPLEKPAQPQLFSGSATQFTLTNSQGHHLNIQAPNYSFIQITDNREWNWPIFALKCFVNLNQGVTVVKFNLAADSAGAGKK